MAEASDRLLQTLRWRVVRRIEGRLQGDHRTVRRGSGLDFAGLRPHVDGDDARRIDWSATARAGELHVREHTEERDLTAWLVLDRSASMTVGAEGRAKDVALSALSLALARLFVLGRNRVGALLYDDGAARVVPPAAGRSQALRLARELERTAVPGRGTTTDLGAMLGRAETLARHGSLVIVISDFVGDGDWERPLHRLARRHEVVALQVTDAADGALPDVGTLVVEDAETGEQLLVDAGDPVFRMQLQDGAAAREEAIAAGMRRAAVPLHRLDADLDVARALAGIVRRTGQVRR